MNMKNFSDARQQPAGLGGRALARVSAAAVDAQRQTSSLRHPRAEAAARTSRRHQQHQQRRQQQLRQQRASRDAAAGAHLHAAADRRQHAVREQRADFGHQQCADRHLPGHQHQQQRADRADHQEAPKGSGVRFVVFGRHPRAGPRGAPSPRSPH